MAAIAYSFHRVNDAKTLLFQCIQIQPPIIIGLLAAASLGLLHNDITLVRLILKELQYCIPNPLYGNHVLTLYAYYNVVGNHIQTAIIILSKQIFKNPSKYYFNIFSVINNRVLFKEEMS